MDVESPETRCFWLHDWHVDPVACRITRSRQSVQLGVQPSQVLLLLSRNRTVSADRVADRNRAHAAVCALVNFKIDEHARRSVYRPGKTGIAKQLLLETMHNWPLTPLRSPTAKAKAQQRITTPLGRPTLWANAWQQRETLET